MNIAELDRYVGEAHTKFTQRFEDYQNKQWEKHGSAKERAAMLTTAAATTMIAGTLVFASPALVAAAAASSAVAAGKMIYHHYMQQNAFEPTTDRKMNQRGDLNLAPQRLDFRPAALLRGFQAAPSLSLKDAMTRIGQSSSPEKQQDAVSSEKKIKSATGPRMGA